MAAASPEDRNPSHTQPAEPPSQDDFAQPQVKFVYHAKDKADKEFYGNQQMIEEFLKKHVFGKIVPGEIVARLEIERMEKRPTELRDLDQTTVRHVDLLWRVRFQDSWLYIVFLFEAQSTVDWRMPLRIMHETALVYQELSKDPEVRKRGKLPPVLPIVVYSGTRPWTATTRLEEMLADEAMAFLPFALGQEFLLVAEAEEAKALTTVDTARDAALRFRYAGTRAESREAVAKLKELLPESSPARDAVVQWVRSRMIATGTKEEHMEQVRELEDLESPIIETIWDRDYREEGRREGREEGEVLGRRATLVRQAGRKFGAGTAKRLAALLGAVSDAARIDQVADLIIDCASGTDLLKQLESPTVPDSAGTAD